MAITVDARGLDCPKPVVKTKEAFEQAAGQPLVVMVSSAASKENVTRFLTRNGVEIDRVEERGNEFHIYTRGGSDQKSPAAGRETALSAVELAPEDYSCTDHPSGTGTAVFITRDRIGSGSDELGMNLLDAFVATLRDLSVQPKTICFMNSGVKLAVKGAPTLSCLQELEEKGIELLVCGTCLNYFNLTQELGAGRISNMYDISETLLKSAKVITI
ncbi:MAG: sulfurtransferase-like selenium metabolism protein YedF [bacterium]